MSGSGRGLLAAELSRFFHRRAIRNALIGSLVTYVVATIAVFVFFAPQPRAQVDAARTRYSATVTQSHAGYDRCAAALPKGRNVRDECGLAPADQDFGDFTQYLAVKPFTLSVAMPQLAQLLGLAFTAIAFLIGATWIGTEWSTGSLALLTTWEPNRLHLLTAKAVALTGAVGVAALGLQAVWVPTSLLLARTRGIEGGPDPALWSQLFALQARLVGLAVVAALVGFAISNLVRGTGATIGIAFGYGVAVEGAVRWLSPSSQTWLVSDNVLAFAQPHRYVITWRESDVLMIARVSHLHAGLAMSAVVTALLVTGALVFRRSDLA
jgi:hypothetical protein